MAAEEKPHKTKDDTQLTPKQLRDVVYAWLYVTVSQAATMSSDPSQTANIVSQFTAALAGEGVTVDPQTLTAYVTAVQNNLAVYRNVAKTMQAGDSGWQGQLDHPTPVDLNQIMADL